MRSTLANKVIFLFILGMAALGTERALAGDWAQFLGPTRNGISDEKGWESKWPNEGPQELWRKDVGTGFSSLAVAGDKAYTMGNVDDQEILYCLNSETGEEIWKESYPCKLYALYHDGGPACTPTIDGDAVFTLGRAGQLYCFDAATGKIRWSKDLPKEFPVNVSDFGISCSPLVEGNKVIVDVGAMAAFDKATGEQIWRSARVPRAFCSPVAFDLEGKRCGATLNGFGLLVFEIGNGNEVCRHPWETFDNTNCTTPIVSGNRIFVSSAYDRGGGVIEVGFGKEPKVIWDNRNMRNHFNISPLWEGHLYGFDGNVNKDNQGELRCLDFENGNVDWTEPSVVKGGLLIADGKIIAISDNGELVVAEASPEKFKVLSRYQVLGGRCWTPPTMANGKIYCRNAKGTVVCLDVRKK
jgi:outer membrane protein assembly factor BamB